MADPGIVRSGAKIDAAIAGARVYVDLRERGEDFSDLAVGFRRRHAGRRPDWTAMGDIPASTPVSEAMAKALKAQAASSSAAR